MNECTRCFTHPFRLDGPIPPCSLRSLSQLGPQCLLRGGGSCFHPCRHPTEPVGVTGAVTTTRSPTCPIPTRRHGTEVPQSRIKPKSLHACDPPHPVCLSTHLCVFLSEGEGMESSPRFIPSLDTADIVFSFDMKQNMIWTNKDGAFLVLCSTLVNEIRKHLNLSKNVL